MYPPDYETALKDAETIEELTRVIGQQVYNEMDIVRALAYWKARLPGLDTRLLAEAMAHVLCRVHATRSAPAR